MEELNKIKDKLKTYFESTKLSITDILWHVDADKVIVLLGTDRERKRVVLEKEQLDEIFK